MLRMGGWDRTCFWLHGGCRLTPTHLPPQALSTHHHYQHRLFYSLRGYIQVYMSFCFSLIPSCHLHNYGPARRQRTASRRGLAAGWGGARPLRSATQLPWTIAGGREAALPLREAPWTHRGLLTSMTTCFFGLLTLHCGTSLPSLPHGLS